MSELTFAPLANFAEITMGQSPESEACNTDNIGLPFLQGCGEFGRRNPKTDTYCSPPLRIGKANATLISVRAPVGTMNYADKDYCIGRGLAAFKSKPGIANDIFLKHAVEQGLGFLHRRSQGSTFAAVSSSDIRSFPIPYFSVPKQNAIASILTSIDTALEKTEALIAKYQQIKAGLMHDLFTRGVLPNGQLRPPREQAPELYQETAIGWIPKDWHAKLTREVCLEVGDGVHYSVNRSPEGVPFLFVSCVRNGQIFWDGAARISPKTYLEISKKCKPYEGLVLLTAVGSYGHAAHVQTSDAFGFERNIAYLKSNGNVIESKYLYYWLTSDCARSQIERLVIGNAQKVLTLGNMEKIVVALPDKSEQLLSIERLTASDSQLLIEHKKLHKFRATKLGLMQDLLTGKVQVKVHEPTPELLHA